MNAYIKRIVLIGSEGEIRTVKLKRGLNIITGDSKTGKSALLEIVDYCFFSKRSTIPKGKIDEFTEIYSIILKVNDIYIVIARPRSDPTRAYINVETDKGFIDDFSANYFTNLKKKAYKTAQIELERYLGLSVADTRISNDDDKRNAGKSTLRSLVSLLLQHQNLIANKHSIFYRFDDFYKRKKTVDDYPMALGWASGEYFSNLRELEEVQNRIKAQEKILSKSLLTNAEIDEKIRSLLTSYYKLIGQDYDQNLSFPEIVELSRNLPDIENLSYANTDLGSAIFLKEKDRDDLVDQLNETVASLNAIEENASISENHVKELKFLELIGSDSSKESAVCPICDNTDIDIETEIRSLDAARKELADELAKIGVYKEDSSNQIEYLRKERNSIKRKISKLTSEISLLEGQENELKAKKALRDQAFLMKGMTKANIETVLSINKEIGLPVDIEELRERAKFLRGELKKFDLKGKMKEAEKFLSQTMTSICNKLDFEEELKPGVLKFELDTFDFYYVHDENEKIHLSEMGSGANWLACHLSLFLSLLYLNCIESKSAIPSILFLDQPSQVYFPRQYGADEGEGDVDENIIQVKNIFKVINDTLSEIHQKAGFLPQVIVMEHADEPEFSDYIKARWKSDGKKLI